MITTRFAPSPTGFLHLGHAYSALLSYGSIEKQGVFLLRIEDIDQGRCRIEFEEAIYEDLNWLGIHWPQPVRRQSEHMADYARALGKLEECGLLYPCFCSRKEIAVAREQQNSTAMGPDGPIYPGSCRQLDPTERTESMAQNRPFALRLDIQKAVEQAGRLSWRDAKQGELQATPDIFGDVVLARKETPASYHLAATLDDHIQEINLVTRGQDLFQATHVHRLLQALLGLHTPNYHHHHLLLDKAGQKFAKRNRSLTLKELRQNGVTPREVRVRVGL